MPSTLKFLIQQEYVFRLVQNNQSKFNKQAGENVDKLRKI